MKRGVVCFVQAIIGILVVLVIIPTIVLGFRLVLGPGPTESDLYDWELVVEGLGKPTAIAHAGDERLFITEAPGTIRIVEDSQILEEPFLDIVEKVDSAGQELGLIGLVFDPDYADNGRFYIFYTGYDEGTLHIERYEVSDDPNLADPDSVESVLDVPQVGPEHNGGGMMFGEDGYLYLSFGDSTWQGSTGQGTGQRLDDLLGKVIRIDVSDLPYVIPPDNPFTDTSDAQPEIWAYGLRNPWRFDFDFSNSVLIIADVGESLLEEINVQPFDAPGLNFGWSNYAGNTPYPTDINPDLPEEDATFPVFIYEHENSLLDIDDTLIEGENCAIVGGAVYEGEVLPDLAGMYVYGDWCSGRVWALQKDADEWVNEKLMDTGFLINTFGEDVNSELYLASLQGGLWKLVGK